MKINQLSHIDLEGSDELNPKVILHLLALTSGQYQTLETLILDCEHLEHKHYEEMVNTLKPKSLKTFRLYFAINLEDQFLLEL